MGNKIILGAIVTIVLAMLLQLTQSDNSTQEHSIAKSNTKEQIQDIEVLHIKKQKVVSKKNIKKSNINIVQKNIDDEILIKTDVEDLKYEQIEKYIKIKDLKKVSFAKKNIDTDEAPQYSVYADISIEEARKNRDKNIPPPTPVFYTVTFPSGQIGTGVIDGDILNIAKETIVTNNDPSGNPIESAKIPNKDEIKNQSEENNDDTEKAIFIAPPSIGN